MLSITAEGYQPYEQTITVGDADTQQLDIRLAPLPGTVTMATQPAGGEIILDELSLGSAPLVDLTLEAGVYRVEAVLDRYQRWQGQIDVVGRSQSHRGHRVVAGLGERQLQCHAHYRDSEHRW